MLLRVASRRRGRLFHRSGRARRPSSWRTA